MCINRHTREAYFNNLFRIYMKWHGICQILSVNSLTDVIISSAVTEIKHVVMAEMLKRNLKSIQS